MLKHEELNWFDEADEFIILVESHQEDLIDNVINWLKDKQFLTKADLYHSHKNRALQVRYAAWEKLSLPDRKYITAFCSGYHLGYKDGYETAIYEETID